jgi:hypothetical protein
VKAGFSPARESNVTLEEIRRTLRNGEPPPGLSDPLRALWHAARGDWTTAHEIAQQVDDETGSWVHAYLHRKEGDLGNAAYWYRRAGQPVATDDLEAEWSRIVTALCDVRRPK